MLIKKLGLMVALSSLSLSALASTQYVAPDWDFRSNGTDTINVSVTAHDGDTQSVNGNKYELTGQVAGIDLLISAWSSSWYGNYAENCGTLALDRCVQKSKLKQYSSGLGVVNGDEGDDTPNHSTDNNNQDYDMVLLSFSESVNISKLYTGWNYSYNGSSRTRGTAGASVLAWGNEDTSPTMPFSRIETWRDIVDGGWSIVNNDTKSGGNVVSDSNGKLLDVLPVSSGNLYSKFWLVGAAHSVFRDAGLTDHLTDHIKIAGIDFVKRSTSTGQVNAPGTLVFFLGCLVFMVARRKS